MRTVRRWFQMSAPTANMRSQKYMDAGADYVPGCQGPAKYFAGPGRERGRDARVPAFRVGFRWPNDSAMAMRYAARHSDFPGAVEPLPVGPTTYSPTILIRTRFFRRPSNSP
jgi:hypothetical protein